MKQSGIIPVFPGTFSPPTYGHLATVMELSKTFQKVIIMCSVNNDKDEYKDWFTQMESLALWQESYKLPENVEVVTFDETKNVFDFSKVIMVRGIRDQSDFEYEKGVVLRNHKDFGISKVLYLMAEPEFVEISATVARESAEDLDFQALAKYVSPMVISALLEKVLKVEGIYMVVGPPGGGKSTFLRELAQTDPKSMFIDTDKCSKDIRSVLIQRFGDVDLVKLFAENDEKVTRVIAGAWFSALRRKLNNLPTGKKLFLEVPYGLMPGKDMYKYLGGRIIYVGHEDKGVLKKRLIDRGTPEHQVFVDKIPDLKQSRTICEKNKLELAVVISDGSVDNLKRRAQTFLKSPIFQ